MDFSEPNNYAFLDYGNITEICGVANFSQASGGTSRWSDVACTLNAPAMCRLQGEAAAAGALVCTPATALAHVPVPAWSAPSRGCLPATAAVPGPCPLVTSPVTNQSYFLNTMPMDFASAEAFCNLNGAPQLL